MAKFYVGQRVRINSPGGDLHGMETTIIALDVVGWNRDGTTFIGAGVEAPAGIDMSDADEDFDGYSYEYHELEPIVDDGRRVISWEEMKDLWTPKELSHV